MLLAFFVVEYLEPVLLILLWRERVATTCFALERELAVLVILQFLLWSRSLDDEHHGGSDFLLS